MYREYLIRNFKTKNICFCFWEATFFFIQRVLSFSMSKEKVLCQGAYLCQVIMVTLKLRTAKYCRLVFTSWLGKYFRKVLDQGANLCHIIMVTLKLKTTKYRSLLFISWLGKYFTTSSIVGFHHIFDSNTKREWKVTSSVLYFFI